jgi:hypothetical protein
LEGDLHPSLGSLGQVLLTKIKYLKLSYKWHLLKFVNMPAKEKIIYVSICDPTMFKIWWAKKPTIGNMASCFLHHWRRHLMSLGSTW